MKNIVAFYLILVVLLSVMPCSDDLQAHEISQNTISAVDQCNKNGSTENCSPICLCTCCGQSLIATQFLNFTANTPIILIDKQKPRFPFSPELRVQNIWQPPKLIS